MNPAVWPRSARLETRLLSVDPSSGRLEDRRVEELPLLLAPGDLLVVNDAATLPAALLADTRLGALEVRLAGLADPVGGSWDAVLFGSGTWRQRTEDRPAPPVLAAEDVLRFSGGLSAHVASVSSLSPRLVRLRFDRSGAELWSALYAAGRPVQYSHVCGPLPLFHVQTRYAGRPWAMEMPSAGWALTAGLLRELGRRDIGVSWLTHAAGLSSTGDAALDAALPLPERYDIPAATVKQIQRARASGGRVVAVGTTVVRALEGCATAHAGALAAGAGRTGLKISKALVPRVVAGLLTGLHEPGTSHFELLGAFAPGATLRAAHRHAEQAGYLAHEFGDMALILEHRGSLRAIA
jgi:S-adenosylmethionine:tRNA ribosyltransferase-isomerase